MKQLVIGILLGLTIGLASTHQAAIDDKFLTAMAYGWSKGLLKGIYFGVTQSESLELTESNACEEVKSWNNSDAFRELEDILNQSFNSVEVVAIEEMINLLERSFLAGAGKKDDCKF